MIHGQVRILIIWQLACFLHNLRACLYGNPVGAVLLLSVVCLPFLALPCCQFSASFNLFPCAGARYFPDLPRGGAPELEEYLEDLAPPLPDLDWADGGGGGDINIDDILDPD